jgi:hypothetical protein
LVGTDSTCGSLAAVFAILAFIFSPFRAVARLWRKPEQVEIVNLPPAPKGQLTVAEFLQIRREMRADLLGKWPPPILLRR